LNIDIIRGHLRTLFPSNKILDEVKSQYINADRQNAIPFMDTPINGNLGDQALAMAGLHVLAQERPSSSFLEIQNYQVRSSLRFLHDNLKPGTPIFWNGGGNIGSLYPYEEHNRWESFKAFKESPIVVFPQSVHFSSDLKGQRMLKSSVRNYSLKKELTVFLREEKSFNFFRKNYPEVESYLAPDTVFLLDEYVSKLLKKSERIGVLFLARNDIERNPQFNAASIAEVIDKAGFQTEVADTYLGEEFVGSLNREALLWKLWNKMATKQVIVTDRLHGMIFAYLTRTPAVVLANNNWKIESTYQTWLKDCNFIHFLSKYDQKMILDSVQRLSNVQPEPVNIQINFDQFFKKLRQV
jgi:pyruvyl transferase EpsI